MPEPENTEPTEQKRGSSESATTNVYNGPVYNAPLYQNNGQAGAMGDYASSAQGTQGEAVVPGHIVEDRHTSAKVKQLLTREGSMAFVEENNFAGFPFENSNMHEIWNFLEKTKDPEFEFLDDELEQSFGLLKDSLARFAHEVATNTFPTTAGWNSVPADFEDRYPERFSQMVNDIHGAASASTEAYRAFVRLSRRKLA